MSHSVNTTLLEVQQELDELRAQHSQFVYAVTHDLAGPFRQIEGFANIIQSKNSHLFDAKTKRHFDLMISASERGGAILEALTDHSRMSITKASLSHVDCGEVIAEAIDSLSALIENSNGKISCNRMPTIAGDSVQLHRLFYHLIHNALLYRDPDRAPLVLLDATELEGSWQFCVKDNGIGFRDRIGEKIFTPLRRGVRDGDYPGIGMGLTIARTVVQRHGGSIWSESEEGVGSSFYFTLDKSTRCD